MTSRKKFTITRVRLLSIKHRLKILVYEGQGAGTLTN